MTELGLIAATDAIVPVELHYLETVGLTSSITCWTVNFRTWLPLLPL